MIITLTKPPTNFIGKGEKILEKYLNSQEFAAIDRSSYEIKTFFENPLKKLSKYYIITQYACLMFSIP